MSREMKDSGVEWIGEIPEDWEIIPNKHLMKKVKNLCPVYNGEDILSLSMKGVYVRDPNDESGKRPTTYNGYQYVQEGDLLMCLFDIDVTPRCVGRVYNNGLTSPAYSRFVMNKTRAIVDYYYYYYLALDFDKTLLHLSKNMRSSLTESDFGSINAPVPSPTEQQQIVHFLDRKCTAIDTAIEKTKKSIEKLEEYKKAVITKAVTNGIDPNAKMKDSGVEWIGEIPEDWEVQKLKHAVTKLSKGNGITKDDVVENGDISCVRYGEIYTQYNYVFDKCKTRTNIGKVSSPQTFSYGDILCAGTGELIDEIGKSVVYLGKELCLAGGDIIVIKHQQDPLFMSFLLNSAYCQGQRSIGKYKLKVVHISAGDIGNIKIALPRLNDQRKIAQFLKEKNELINGMIEAKINSIKKLEEYKKSLIYYAVTGKIDCRGEEL